MITGNLKKIASLLIFHFSILIFVTIFLNIQYSLIFIVYHIIYFLIATKVNYNKIIRTKQFNNIIYIKLKSVINVYDDGTHLIQNMTFRYLPIYVNQYGMYNAGGTYKCIVNENIEATQSPSNNSKISIDRKLYNTTKIIIQIKFKQFLLDLVKGR